VPLGPQSGGILNACSLYLTEKVYDHAHSDAVTRDGHSLVCRHSRVAIACDYRTLLVMIWRKSPTAISLIALVLLHAVRSYGQQWSGILSPNRAIDWSGAGVTGGIPARSTIYRTLGSPDASSSTVQSVNAAQINSALKRCPAGQVVLLNPGIYYLSNSVIMQGVSNCSLRGSGADQTDLVFTGTAGCFSTQATSVCITSGDNNFKTGPSNLADWTTGYAAGTTTITLASVPNLRVGTPIILDQCDSGLSGAPTCSGTVTDDGSVLVTDSNSLGTAIPPGLSGPYSISANNGGAQRSGRQQEQIVTVTGCGKVTMPGASCSGRNVSVAISPGIYMANWASGNSPQAWWASSPAFLDGIENLTVDDTNNPGALGIESFNCSGCWVQGVRVIDPSRAHVQFTYSTHNSIRDNYFYLSQGWTTASYGVESFSSSDCLIENNIFQAIASPYMLNGPGSGDVFGYNFSILEFFNTRRYNQNSHGDHTAGTDMFLVEGNSGNTVNADTIHGTHNFGTYFRNRFSGPAPTCWSGSSNTSTSVLALSTGTFGPCNSNLQPISLDSFTRFFNIIGNVLGTLGVNTVYESSSNNNPAIRLGLGNAGVPADPNVQRTTMVWGNCNSSNNFGACPFNSDEVPSSLKGSQAPYSNPVPSSKALTASFYYSSKPSWWPSGKAWPPIGPDVKGGNIPGTGGFAYSIPAQDCYTKMGGSANGIGAALTFNENACYLSPSAAAMPQPPASSLSTQSIPAEIVGVH
jgi:hypothetical protein